MYLGIEIGGTKLQLGLGDGAGGPLAALEQRVVAPEQGAAGILRQLEEAAATLMARHPAQAAGIGFGGPVVGGRVVRSHQIRGWEDFDLQSWCRQRLGLAAAVANDCDVAALAEARFGAGRGADIVFYVTVGTGVGGGLVVGGQLHGSGRPAVAEIGHLRPGPQAERAEQTVESLASGWGIAAEAAARVRGDLARPLHNLAEGDPATRARRLQSSQAVAREYADDLLARCGGDLDRLTAKQVADAAGEGNQLAAEALEAALRTLGWAVAQVITLTAAEVVVVGGGVSLIGEARFFQPLRREVERYVFPPLTGHYRIAPAELGEQVVVHGALALAGGCAANAKSESRNPKQSQNPKLK